MLRLCLGLLLLTSCFANLLQQDSPSLSSLRTAFKQDMTEFWEEYERYLKPAAPPGGRLQTKPDTQRPDWSCCFEHIDRPDLLIIPNKTFEFLTHTHNIIAQKAEILSPQLPYIAGTSGIVMTCGPKDINYLLLSIKMLRRTGSQLPIEFFVVSEEEYDKKFCEEILPGHNGRCVLMTDIPMEVKISKYQYKVFAMLFSSFENVFFLDADDLLMSNPDELFTTGPYVETGMIIWRDFNSETVSPRYYDMIGKKATEKMYRHSAESGQLLISKEKHAKTLLLAIYYNLYGPNHYYRLFSQGNNGEGDKETFYVAAEYYNLPYYMVRTGVYQLCELKYGRNCHLAMLQPHPVDDWKRHTSNDNNQKVRWLFIHQNIPKFDIPKLLKTGSLAINDDGTFRRVWASEQKMIEAFGFDVEKVLWQEIIEVCKILYPGLLPTAQKFYNVIIEQSEPQPPPRTWLSLILTVISLILVSVATIGGCYVMKHKEIRSYYMKRFKLY